MKRTPRLWLLAAGLQLFAASCLFLSAQSKTATAADQERVARAQALLDQNSGGPDLIEGPNGKPVLRYPVAHQHAATGCLGWLYITRETMRFEVLYPPQDKEHAFERPRSELTTAKQWRFWGRLFPEAEFKFSSGGTYHFFHVRKKVLNENNTKFGYGDVLDFQELINGAQNFDDIVALLKSRQAPPAPTAPPPTLSMLDPSGAAEGQTVPAYDSTLRVRGIASQASGIASVTVNGQTAFFKPLAPQTVEFELRDLPLSSGLSAVVIVATATDKSVGQMTFRVSRPEVRVLEPGAGAEVEAAAVRVRGLAVGFRDVDRVEVAGQTATLRRRDDSSVEFDAAGVPLAVGDNSLQGSVVTSAGQRQSFALSVTRRPPPGPLPLTLQDVQQGLEGGLSTKKMSEMAAKYGVDFEVTDDVEKRLRSVGADSGLLLDLVKAYKGPVRPKPIAASSPPASQPASQPAPRPVSAPVVSQPVAQAPPPAPPKPTGPPALKVLDPAGVEEGKAVETSGSVVRGTATHSSGISAVMVNDKPATMTAVNAQTVQFQATGLTLSEAWTPVTIVARAVDNTQSRLSFRVSRPTVQWLNPPNGIIETPATAILAQGVAIGFNGVEKVELAGNALSLEKLPDGKVEFHTILPLALGQNTFQGIVVGTSGFRVAFKLEVKRVAASAQDSPK